MKHLSPAEIETIRVPEPKHDPFTLESLVAWLERQNPSHQYCFSDWGQCLLARWTQSIDPSASAPLKLSDEQPTGFHYVVAGTIVNLRDFRKIAAGNMELFDWTFGAALTRARAALASQKGNALAAARTQGSE